MTDCEQNELDALELSDAKTILHQLGYFADDTHFMSLRLTASELKAIQRAAATTSLELEPFLAQLCERRIQGKEKKCPT